MQFKTVWIKEQFESKELDPDLKILLLYADLYTRKNFNKECVITEILRTRQEQVNLYKNKPKYIGKLEDEIPHSVHEYGRGGDLRTSHLEYFQKIELLEALNSIPYGKGRFQTAIYHDIGTGEHIHVQVKYNGRFK